MFPVMRWLATFLSTSVLCSPLFALCSQPHPRLVCAEYFESEIVVEAKLVSIQHTPERDAADGHLYHMRTSKILRGEVGESFNIYEENSSGRATFDWEVGRSYLLFLLSYWEKDGGWVIDGCGNSGPLSRAQAALETIDEIPQAKDGTIQVVIGLNREDQGKPVRVQATDAAHSYRSITNTSGIANIHVPAGEYKVSIPGESKFQVFDFSYENPQKVTIEAGGCAQIQFVAAQ